MASNFKRDRQTRRQAEAVVGVIIRSLYRLRHHARAAFGIRVAPGTRHCMRSALAKQATVLVTFLVDSA